jgi:hypothetical protein
MISFEGHESQNASLRGEFHVETRGTHHSSNLAKLWGDEDYFGLTYSDSAVRSNAEATLMLTP